VKKTTQPARLSLAASMLLLGCITGCASRSPELRLTSLATKASFSQQFTEAYVATGAEGDTEVVLTNDDGDLRHVMHVKVLWRPQRGTKQSHPSYTNAGIHWYVFNQGARTAASARSPDVLEYTGAGFVRLAETPGGTQVTIRNATLKPVAAAPECSLNDPVGPSKLTGTFLAKKSSKRVNALLAEVKHATNGARAEQASAR
jgi:hypothetical protein